MRSWWVIVCIVLVVSASIPVWMDDNNNLSIPSIPSIPSMLSIPTIPSITLYNEEAAQLDSQADGVKFPSNMASLTVAEKKATFVRIVLPLIEQENAKILHEYRLAIDDKSNDISNLYKKYNVKNGNKSELLKRIQPIPVSLALAQAANESGWGTSYFASKGNALFGQHASKSQSSVPQRFKSKYRVVSYKSLAESVSAYMLNLNTHRAYKELREYRHQNPAASGAALARFLIRYSVRRTRYIKELISMISFNKWSIYDRLL